MHVARLTCLAAVAALALGCGPRHWPEGVYPCQVDGDCPPAWFCHTNALCYSLREVPAVDAAIVDADSDAGILDARPTDARMGDAGCLPATEICNGADDDCDGMIDEDLAVVGPPVPFSTSTDPSTPQLVGVNDGFAVVSGGWLFLDAGGVSQGLATPISQAWGYGTVGVGFDGARIVVASPNGVGLYAAPGGAAVWSGLLTFAPPSGSRHSPSATLTDVQRDRFSYYAGVADSSGRVFIHRIRVDTSVSGGAVDGDMLARTMGLVDERTTWAATRVGTSELLLFFGAAGLEVMRGDAGGGSFITSAGIIVPTRGSVAVVAAGASRTEEDVSSENPCLVVWQDSASEVTRFARITSLVPWTVDGPYDLPGAGGLPGMNAETVSPYVTLVPAAADVEQATGHWYVAAAVQPSGSSLFGRAALAVWEISASSPRGRLLPIDENLPFNIDRSGIAAARSGRHARVASRTETGYATRAIGCE